MFQPWVSFNGSFASVSIVVQEFFTCLNVPGSYEDEMRHTIDVMELGLTIATLAVINEPSQTIRFFRSIDTVGFAEVLEVVHVAACGWVLSIHSLSFLGISDLDEIPMILNHKFSSIKMFSSNYSSPFAIDVINLLS